MNPGFTTGQTKARLLVFWILWASILTGLTMIYLLFGQGPVQRGQASELAIALIAMAQMFVSIVIRWLVLPRVNRPGAALAMFIVGLAMAESCGIIGIFLGGAYRDHLFVLGLLGATSYVPFFAKRWLEPKVTGFIPNN